MPPHATKPWLIALVAVLAGLFISVPLLFWYQTWFGRELSARDIDQYLVDPQHSRRTQHALTQVAERIIHGEPAARAWYARVVELARHPKPEIRATVAWVMGQDNACQEFHDSLRRMLADTDLTVRRNAALALVRFADAAGRAELVNTLRPIQFQAPAGGKISLKAHEGQELGRGTLLARIDGQDGGAAEIRSAYAGRLEKTFTSDGSEVSAGDRIALVGPDPNQVWESLRALYLIGQPEDLQDVNRFGDGSAEISSRVRQQAIITAQAIRTRSAHTPTR
jgi:hypothetical protein